MASKQQTMGFQTEVKQILNLVVHSLYSNKEIFLRELVSNASDALDKLRFLALSKAELYEDNADLLVTLSFDEKKKTLTITDNGIGMSWDEAVENLGTIAKSGTKDFLSHLTGDQAKDSQLIGQFGVGFYSSFIVADKVTVKSRRAGLRPEEGVVWESKGDGEFTIANLKQKARGTTITLHLKSEEATDLLSDWRLRSLVNKYSDHIAWPIAMQKTAEATEESATEEGDKQAKESKKAEPEFETINKATALWTQSKADISEEDYKAFYKHVSHDYQEPLSWSHNQVEGKQDYTTLLYIPAHAPFDLWQADSKHGLKLYVKRIFILDDATQFLPRYLRFIKGIVDASDLPLNVSREILQDNKQVDSIRTACTKRVLSLLDRMSANEAETYQTFWDEFGAVLKEGPVEDTANRERITKLLRFASTHTDSEKQTVSLADYVSRMQEGQDKIYYVTAPSYNAAKHSPHLEIFKKKGIEVLLLSDRVDEWLVGHLSEFEEKKLQSITKGKLELDGDNAEEKKETAEKDEGFASMLKQMQEVLGERVKDVRITHRLTDSPACVVADENDMGLEMQRILQSAGQAAPPSKPVFEINPEHALLLRVNEVQDDDLFKEWTEVLFEQALLAEGGTLDNPAAFVKRMNRLLVVS
ncbi:MAG: molecular chaperone HtpG [Gammaproteobacteria bacterium]|nr:molecular chaperone HtpG [Gammaproteobacteria bacterium]